MLVQYFPGDSLLHRLDPRTKVAAVLLVASSVLAAANWPGLLLAAAPVLAAMALTRLPLRVFWRGLRGLWVLLAITFLVQLFTTPGETLLALGPLKISQEGLVAAALIFLRLSLLILAASLLTLTTSPISLTAGLESILSPFRRLGVPAYELAMMMTIALRFIPTLLQEAQILIKAQRSRGAHFSAGSPANWARSLLPLFVPLFAGALRRAEDLATAMEARCYRGGANRTRIRSLRFTSLDYAAGGAGLAILAGTVALRLL
jgi:energy-coupling factor transport system permease protein